MIKAIIKKTFLYRPLLAVWNSRWVQKAIVFLFHRDYAFEKNVGDYEGLQKRCEPREHYEERVEQAQFICLAVSEAKRVFGDAWASVKVLDIGARDGWSVSFISQLGSQDVVGVELVSEYVEYSQAQGRHVIKAQGEGLDFPDETFSLVMSRHTLEHSENPVHFISESFRVLADEGVFVLSFPMQLMPSGKHCSAIPSSAAFMKLLGDAGCADRFNIVYAGRSVRRGLSADDSEFLFVAQKL